MKNVWQSASITVITLILTFTLNVGINKLFEEKGKINFGGKTYYIMPGGAGAYLKFEMKKVKEYKTTSQKAKGRTIK